MGVPHLNRRGFTLIEISIAVATIATVSAISVPAINRVRISGHEGTAQAALSTFRAAMQMYRAVNGRYPTDLQQLGPAANALAYVDARLAGGNRQGYNYLLSNAGADTFTITAVPEQPGVSGVRRFQLTEGGDIQDVDALVAAQRTPAANIARRSDGWFTDGKEMWTFWGRKWLEYDVDFGNGGAFNVGLSARNEGSLPPPPPKRGTDGQMHPYRFAVDVFVDGRYKATVRLNADGTQYDSQSALLALAPGQHTVRYQWNNDSYRKGVYDANIHIKDVFFTRQR